MKYYVYYDKNKKIKGISHVKSDDSDLIKCSFVILENPLIDDILARKKRFADYFIEHDKIYLREGAHSYRANSIFFEVENIEYIHEDTDIVIIIDKTYETMSIQLRPGLKGIHTLYLTELNNPYFLLKVINVDANEKSFIKELKEKDFSIYYTDPKIKVVCQIL